MKTLIGLLACLLSGTTSIPTVQAGKAILYEYEIGEGDRGPFVEFFRGENSDFELVPRDGGKNCGGDSWAGFIKNLERDTSNRVWLKTEPCGNNVYVCMDVEDSGRTFINHFCGTLGW